MKVLCVYILLLISVVCAEQLYSWNYPGHKVVRTELLSQKQINFVQSLSLDVWSRESTLGLGENDILVNETIIQELQSVGIHFTVYIPDVEALLVQEKKAIQRHDNLQAGFHTSYHSFAEINLFLQNLTAHHPHLIQYVPSIGKTVQSRDIPAVRITSSSSSIHKKRIFFTVMQHAREWISGATILYIVDELVTTYGKNRIVTNILDHVEFIIVPVSNPDGYEFSRTSDRMWRKNRKHSSGNIYGVDINRNWDDHWGEQGSSKVPSSETYCGTAPFSEPETQAISKYMLSHAPLDGYIDWHSYSQLVMRPYGWTTEPPPNEDDLKHVGDSMRDVIRSVHGTEYTSQPGWALYYTAGTARDWGYTEAQTPLVFTIELRDTGRYGFLLPADQIIPTGQENLAAVAFFSEYIIAQP